jgi:hypothetical protein
MNKFETNKITKEEFLNLKEDDLMFITNPGRMGDEDGSTFIIKKGNEFIIYRVDGWMYPSEHRDENYISLNDMSKQFPIWFDTWKHFNDKDYKSKYKYVYMGFGNGLSIDDSLYDEYISYLNKLVEEDLKDKEDKESLRYSAIYSLWGKAFINMINNKEYILKH